MNVMKRFFTVRVIRHWNKVPTEVVTAANLSEFQKCLDNTARHMVYFGVVGCRATQLNSMILVGSFQFRIFHDSVCMYR